MKVGVSCERNFESQCVLIQFPIDAISSHYKSLPLYAAETPLKYFPAKYTQWGAGLQQGPQLRHVFPRSFPGKECFRVCLFSYANSPCENTVNESAPKCLFSPFSVQQKSPMVTHGKLA